MRAVIISEKSILYMMNPIERIIIVGICDPIKVKTIEFLISA